MGTVGRFDPAEAVWTGEGEAGDAAAGTSPGAIEVLKDAAKRKEYDEIRKYGSRQGEAFRPPPGQEAGPAGGGWAGGR